VPNLKIDISQNPPMDISGHGYWWFPGYPENKVSGVFSYNSTDGGVLTTIGSLKVPSENEFDAVIFGEVKGRKYTLDSGFRTGVSEIFASSPSIEESWTCLAVFIGSHLVDGARTEFNALELTTKLLPNWVNKPRPSINLHDANRIEASTEIPASLNSDLGNGTNIKLAWLTSHQGSLLEASARVTPVLFIKTNASDLYAIHDHLVTPLIYLTSFCLGSVDAVDSLALEYVDSVTSETIKVRVFEMRWNTSNVRIEPRYPHEQLVQFAEVEAMLEGFLNSWFQIFELAKFSLIDYFAAAFDRHMYSEEKFLRVIRSLESWHGFYDPDAVSSTFLEVQRIMGDLKTLIPLDDFKILHEKVGSLKAPSLRERLVTLINNAEPSIKAFIERTPDFAVRCVKTRNKFTHHTSGNGHFSDENLFWAEQYACVLFVSLILRQLGFSRDDMERDLRRSQLGKLAKFSLEI